MPKDKHDAASLPAGRTSDTLPKFSIRGSSVGQYCIRRFLSADFCQRFAVEDEDFLKSSLVVLCSLLLASCFLLRRRSHMAVAYHHKANAMTRTETKPTAVRSAPKNGNNGTAEKLRKPNQTFAPPLAPAGTRANNADWQTTDG